MIAVTNRAKEELKKILKAKVNMPQARLRLLSRSKGQLGLGVDSPHKIKLVTADSPSTDFADHIQNILMTEG